MSDYSVRLGSTLTFNTEKEKDIIEMVERLSSKHKLGELISHLIRVAFESPEAYNSKEKLQQMITDMAKLGISKSRYDFFNSIASEVAAMKNKVNDIYDMCLKMESAIMLGKRLGIEGKIDNALGATFLLEQQLEKLSQVFGIDKINTIFNSNKILETKQKASDLVAYTLETYGDMLNKSSNENTENNNQAMLCEIEKSIENILNKQHQMLQDTLSKMAYMQAPIVNSNIRADTTVNSESKVETAAKSGNDTQEKAKDKVSGFSIETSTDDEFIDFGEADMDALSSFLGE